MASPGAFIKPTSASISMKAFRARSASTSDVRSGVRSISVERPGTPRSSANIEVFDFANLITSSTNGSNLNFHARSASTLSIGSSDPLSHSFPGSSGNFLSPRPAFLMQDKAFSGSGSLANRLSKTLGGMHLNVEERKKLAMSNMLTYELVLKMEYYSKFTPTSVSMSQFFDHGDCGNGVKKSFIFLRREIPVRLANIMMELELMPPELLAQPACMDIMHQYCQSFGEVLKFESAESNTETHEEFNKLLSSIRHRHQDTVVHMAEALHTLKDKGILHVNSKDKFNQAIQYFLDRLYMSRISINMLISHNKALYCPEESKNRANGLKGTIDPKCDAVKIARSAYQNAVFLCDQIYMDAPKLSIDCVDLTDPEKASVEIVYIPGHLYQMLFEVFKNSMRATMEFHADSDSIPEIQVKIVKSSEDISIKVSDQGGGISRSVSENIFLYLYTSASRVKLSEGDMGGTKSTQTPMHGLGYGLPLSRLYARYFGGDIKVASVDGYGTDTYIYLRALETDARETLPIFNLNSSNKLKNTKNQVDDWTNDE